MRLTALLPAEGAPHDRDVIARSLLETMERLSHAHDRRVTATHEAGHVVMCELKGVEIRRASIEPELGHTIEWGHVLLRHTTPALPSRSDAERIRAEEELLVLAAGDVAESIAGYARDGANQAREVGIGSLALLYVDPQMSDEERHAFVAWIVASARRRLLAAWPRVCRVRDALLERTTLSGDDLKSLRESAPLGPTRHFTQDRVDRHAGGTDNAG